MPLVWGLGIRNTKYYGKNYRYLCLILSFQLTLPFYGMMQTLRMFAVRHGDVNQSIHLEIITGMIVSY